MLKKKVKLTNQNIDNNPKVEKENSDENYLNDSSCNEILDTLYSSSGESDDGFSEKEFNADTESSSKTEVANKRKNNENNLATKKMKAESKRLLKAPTVEEITKLKETEMQFNSNMFRFQIEEMLKELKMKNKIRNVIDEWLNDFNLFLKDLKSQTEKFDSKNLIWIDEKPFKNSYLRKNITKQNFQFQFLKPSKPATFIGSLISNSFIDSVLIIDVCIEIPAKTFQKGDYLNMIYEEKRSLYMLYLVHKMVESKKYVSEQIHYNYYKNNRLKTVLEIDIDGKYENKLTFRIFPVAEENSFKLNRFVPWNSNIRCNIFGENCAKEDEVLYATPYYNSNILFDLTMKKNNDLIKAVIGKNKNLQEGLVLLKIWLQQRALSEGFSAFGNHIITLLIVWLYQQRKLNTGMSNYQIARNVWHYLSTSSWNEEGKSISLYSHENDSTAPTIENITHYFDLVFVDSTGFLNICAFMSFDVYLRIKYESGKAIELLNNNKVNSFKELFMTKLPCYIQYDHIFGFKRSDIKNYLQQEKQKADKHNFAGCWLPHGIKIVTNILRKGLSDRILSITPLETISERWSLQDHPTKINQYIRIGLILNPIRYLDVLDKGPQANDPKANEFREFWGQKSELRRFQDGSITEACVWGSATETLKEKRLIIKNIILHLIKLHFHIADVIYLANQFDCTYELDKEFLIFESSKRDAECYTIDVIKNFDDIGKKFRALQDLPLDVISIQGTSPVFRYAEPIPILNHARICKINKNDEYPKALFQAFNINDGVIELETSGKWPNDLSAFRRIKTAFHIQLAQTFKKVYKIEARGGIEGIQILNNGFLYRIEIFHPKEIALLKKSSSSKGIIRYVDTIESISLEKRLSILPKITSALHGLYQQFSSYGPTVMIAKRWLNSQLLDSYHFPEECIELLIASQFLKHTTLSNPCQPQNGFLRFLYLLANTKWKTEMFFLNFNDDINQEEITELEENFLKERNIFPPLFIATSFDDKRYGLWWTKESPTVHILARVTILARQALEIITPSFNFERKITLNHLFIPSLEGYDVIITLNESLIQTCLTYNFGRQPIFNDTIPLGDFNPVLKGLNDLRVGYSQFALFFYNLYGGQVITVKWKPNIFNLNEFDLCSINSCQPSKDSKMVCKAEKLINDFKIILKGLIRDIQLINS